MSNVHINWPIQKTDMHSARPLIFFIPMIEIFYSPQRIISLTCHGRSILTRLHFLKAQAASENEV